MTKNLMNFRTKILCSFDKISYVLWLTQTNAYRYLVYELFLFSFLTFQKRKGECNYLVVWGVEEQLPACTPILLIMVSVLIAKE